MAAWASYCSQINSFHELELGGFHWASSPLRCVTVRIVDQNENSWKRALTRAVEGSPCGMCDLAHIHEEDFGRSSVCKFHQVRGRHGRLHPEIHTAKTYNLRRPFYPRATQRRGRSPSSAFRYRQSDCLATILDALRIDEIPAFDLVHSTEGLRAGERDPSATAPTLSGSG